MATAADVSLLAKVERSATTIFQTLPNYKWDDHVVPSETLASMVTENLLWVACDDQGEITGFAGCQKIDDFLYIHEISVARDFQKQGVGRRLMQTAIAAASGKNLVAIGLTTSRQVPWNIPFYQSLGFSETCDAQEWPGLFAQARQEMRQGTDPKTRCVMIRKLP